MNVDKIMALITVKLADDYIPAEYLIPFMDEVIDEINSSLNSCYPSFTEFIGGDFTKIYLDYNCIPDQYLRTVVVYGAATKWYSQDEEGIGTAVEYSKKYDEHKFFMLRDHSSQVPAAYRAQPTGFYESKPEYERGVFAFVDWEDLM